MRTYGQYCPVARTSELFAERWTPIILKNLLIGCRTFSELRDGAPGISKALLAQRLELLERHGILVREPLPSGRGHTYAPTDKGREMKAIIDAMGFWGARWLELEEHHCEAAYVLWATCRVVDLDKVPSKGLIARIDLADRPKEHYWMLLKRPYAELCSTQPGRTEDLIIRTDSQTLARWHLKHITWDEAIRAGRIRPEGSPSAERMFLNCIKGSPYAAVERAFKV
ncbi:MAG TPA: helix-turn-helix domain-containing protein [Actinomycetes bacterium]|nr:helix-turn-helix domain-containing protein [Actinomycetes bacterium]